MRADAACESIAGGGETRDSSMRESNRKSSRLMGDDWGSSTTVTRRSGADEGGALGGGLGGQQKVRSLDEESTSEVTPNPASDSEGDTPKKPPGTFPEPSGSGAGGSA